MPERPHKGSLFEVFRLHLSGDILLQSAAVRDHRGALNGAAEIKRFSAFAQFFSLMNASAFTFGNTETLSGLIMTPELMQVICSLSEIHLSSFTINKGPFSGISDALQYGTRNNTICLSSAARQEVCVLLQECNAWRVNWSFIRNFILHCQNKLTTVFPWRHLTGYG